LNVTLACRFCGRRVVKNLSRSFIDEPGVLEALAKDDKTICEKCLKLDSTDVKIVEAVYEKGLLTPKEISEVVKLNIELVERRMDYMVKAKILFKKN